jgi:8-oxo-dGTP pyrophosphatase MutT (NUDIX family)
MTSQRPRKEKVLTYITMAGGNGDTPVKLLVFRQPEFPDAGVQVPAGTIEPHEDKQNAALREAEEETGLRDLRVERFLGSYEYDMLPYRDEVQTRHVFHLTVPHALPRWQHYERNSSTGSDPISFEFEWVDLSDTSIELAGGQGHMLPALRASISATSNSGSLPVSRQQIDLLSGLPVTADT